ARLQPAPGLLFELQCLRSQWNLPLLSDDRQDVAAGQDQVLLALDLDLGPAVLGVDDLVPLLDVQGNAVLALLVPASGSDGDHGALLGPFLRGVRNDDPGSRRLLLFA